MNKKLHITLVLVLFTFFGHSQINTYPYFEDFESSNGGWYNTSTLPTSWEYGTPNYGVTTGAHSGTKCWDINLDTTYFDNAEAYLYTPEFDISVIGPCKISFWHNFKTENHYDGTRLEYSVDGGMTWLALGTQGDTNAINWYNDLISGGFISTWGNESGGWINSTYAINSLTTYTSIQFRFIFTSDLSVTKDGYSIDDFSLSPIYTYDPELTEITINSTIYPAGAITDSLKFSIKNSGTSPISNINYNYTVNGILQQSSLYPDTIFPGNSIITSLPGFQINQASNYIYGSINQLNDEDTTNNLSNLTILQVSVYDTSFIDNFENGSLGWQSISTGSAGTNWELGTPSFGATSTTHSGNNVWDINLTSAYGNNANCILYSPYFDLASMGPCIVSFWQNFNIFPYDDGITIEYNINNGIWANLGMQNDTNAVNWFNDSLTATPYWTWNSSGWIKSSYYIYPQPNSQIIRFRFIFKSNFVNVLDGVSIDDFSLTELPDYDPKLSTLTTSEIAFPIGSITDSIQFQIRNAGVQPISNLNLNYSVNGITQQSGVYSNTIFPGQTITTALPGYLVNQLNNNICGSISYINDADTTNNNYCFSLLGIPTYIPSFIDNFDSANTGWHSESLGQYNINWELGTPAFWSTTGTHSGINAWDINLNSGYFSNTFCALYSPIFDLSTATSPALSFWQNRKTETGWDGFWIEYKSADSSLSTWQQLGTTPLPGTINWYNGQLNFNAILAWDGSSSGWEYSRIQLDLPQSSHLYQFRFVFYADPIITMDGVSIDDFAISAIAAVNEHQILNNLNIYPNPVYEIVYVACPQQLLNETIEIKNTLGQIVYQQKIDKEQFEIDVKRLSPGVYYLVTGKEYKTTTKFIKQ